MNITVYSTTTCATCHILTQWFDKQGISYTKKNTDEDPAAMVEFMGVNDGMIGVPFTVIENNGEITKFSGYDVKQLQSLLAIQ